MSNDEKPTEEQSQIPSSQESEIDEVKQKATNQAKYIATFCVTLIETKFGKIVMAGLVVLFVILNMEPEERNATFKKYQGQIISSAAAVLTATFIGGGNKES